MLDVHRVLAYALVAVCAGAGLTGAFAYARGRDPGVLSRQLLALAQTLLVAQVALGLLLLGDDRQATDDLHYVYGTLSLCAVLSPWLYAPREPRLRLLWFTVATLLAAALGVRAWTTGA
jgi:hypothetical protein